MIYGLLIHLGRNMWAPHKAADHVRCDEKIWTEITEHMADVGANMLYTVKEAEKHGCRGWIWSDYQWLHKDEFFEKCPRNILQSHWFYHAGFDKPERDDKAMREAPWAESHTLCVFKELDEAGYDQICCGSNIYNQNNFPDLVKHCLRNVSRERLLGFLNAPWGEVDATPKGRARYLNAVDQLAGARGMIERYRRLNG